MRELVLSHRLHLFHPDSHGRPASARGLAAAGSPAGVAADRPPQPPSHLHKSPPDLGAAEAVDVEVKGKVDQLQVVGDGAKDLEAQVAVKPGRVEDGEYSGRGGAADKQDHDGDEDEDEHPLLGALQRAVLVATTFVVMVVVAMLLGLHGIVNRGALG